MFLLKETDKSLIAWQQKTKDFKKEKHFLKQDTKSVHVYSYLIDKTGPNVIWGRNGHVDIYMLMCTCQLNHDFICMSQFLTHFGLIFAVGVILLVDWSLIICHYSLLHWNSLKYMVARQMKLYQHSNIWWIIKKNYSSS